jgi:hypothetical protein
LVDELTFVTMGSKDCCFSNFTLFLTILIYNAVKDWILGHFNLIWAPQSFSNHKLCFKFLTLYKIKMTQEWINMVDNGSNKVQTMSFWWAQVFHLPDVINFSMLKNKSSAFKVDFSYLRLIAIFAYYIQSNAMLNDLWESIWFKCHSNQRFISFFNLLVTITFSCTRYSSIFILFTLIVTAWLITIITKVIHNFNNRARCFF